MLRLRPDHAKPGLELAMSVFHPKSHDTLLLKSGVVLNERTVARLRELNIPEIWVSYPRLAKVAAFVSPKVESNRAMVTRNIAEAFDMAGASMHARLEYNAYENAVDSLMTSLRENPKANVYMTDLVDSGQPAVRHAASVCYLSLLIGLQLGPYLERERPKLRPELAREIKSLGLAAMMHDIGVTQLPKDVVERYARTLDDTDEAWREHVQLGYAMVRGNLDPTAAAAVLHHHQRFDGTGFPTRTTAQGEELAGQGRDIHIFARIIAAANLYDRLMHPAHVVGSDEGLHGSEPSVRALRMMLESPRRGWIDPFVFAALLAVCPPYPPGCIVTLNDGRRVVVESWDAREPCRPGVVEFNEHDDGEAQTAEPAIDLRRRPELWIASIDGHDVSDDNFPGSMLPARYGDAEREAHEAADEKSRLDTPGPMAA